MPSSPFSWLRFRSTTSPAVELTKMPSVPSPNAVFLAIRLSTDTVEQVLLHAGGNFDGIIVSTKVGNKVRRCS